MPDALGHSVKVSGAFLANKPNGGLWAIVAKAMHLKGLASVAISKVKSHLDIGHVLAGRIGGRMWAG
eukprot:11564402-Alexandrium_andersonii.AAC.1